MHERFWRITTVLLLGFLLLGVYPTGAVTPPPSKFDKFLNSVVVVRSSAGEGAGFFITADGLIVTNHHVVGNDAAVSIKLRDGRSGQGKVISVNRNLDLALVTIPIESPEYLSFAKPNDGGIGSDVIAIGTAKGLSWSVSKGIVSGLRDGAAFGIGGGEEVLLIQTDAAINQGNSGGPLILVETGTVIGVNTISFKKHIAEGISFAVSAENAKVAFTKYLKPQTRVKLDRPLTRREVAKQRLKAWLAVTKKKPEDGSKVPVVTIENAKTYVEENQREGKLFIVTGRATNRRQTAKSYIRLRGYLHDKDGNVLSTKMVYCGNLLADSELRDLSMSDIEKRLNLREGLRGANEKIPPGHSVTFMVVFNRISDTAAEWSVEVFSFE